MKNITLRTQAFKYRDEIVKAFKDKVLKEYMEQKLVSITRNDKYDIINIIFPLSNANIYLDFLDSPGSIIAKSSDEKFEFSLPDYIWPKIRTELEKSYQGFDWLKLTSRESIDDYEEEIIYTTKVIRDLLDFIERNRDGFKADYIHEKYLRIQEGGENLVICHQNIYNLKRKIGIPYNSVDID